MQHSTIDRGRHAGRLSGEWVGFREAIAWIVTRDSTFASGIADQPPVRWSLILASWQSGEGSRRRSPWFTSNEAKEHLLRHLRQGDLTAQGVIDGDMLKAFRPVPATDWTSLKFGEREQRPIAESWATGRFVEWGHLLFRSADLLALFPRTHATVEEKRGADRAAAEMQFDPMAEARWSVLMTLAWIVSRSASEVRNQWDEFRHVVGERPTTWDDVLLAHAYDQASGAENDYPSVEHAWSELRRALSSGSIVAEGFEGDQASAPIGSGNWSEMDLAYERVDGFVCRPHRRHVGFYGVTMRSEDVRMLWPADADGADAKRDYCQEEPSTEASAGLSEASVRLWVRDRLERWREEGGDPKARPTEAIALDEFGQENVKAFGRNRFLGIWRELKPSGVRRGRR